MDRLQYNLKGPVMDSFEYSIFGSVMDRNGFNLPGSITDRMDYNLSGPFPTNSVTQSTAFILWRFSMLSALRWSHIHIISFKLTKYTVTIICIECKEMSPI